MDEAFYLVWNPEKNVPKIKHSTAEIAMDEAKRLAGVNPGQEFVVLSSLVSVVSNFNTKSFRTKGDKKEIKILPELSPVATNEMKRSFEMLKKGAS